MGNAGSMDQHTDFRGHNMPLKLPMPEPSELEERFATVLSSMNLPPDKARLLRQYDNEKKWELICDQERFQVKNPPHTYLQKLRSYLDPAVTRKVSALANRLSCSTAAALASPRPSISRPGCPYS
ncbi:Formin-like protein 2 [Dissostichus eleginoides]|nr:Formin-like protein 2 [Dissostichus eleginoides]